MKRSIHNPQYVTKSNTEVKLHTLGCVYVQF